MIFISYYLGCRECLKSIDAKHSYSLMDGDLETYKKKTEFEVMNKIEDWLYNDNKVCMFCGSNNIEVYDIYVNETPLYDYDKLINRCKKTREYLFEVVIEKDQLNILTKKGGHNKLSNLFLENAIDKIKETIHQRPNSDFIPHDIGTFMISICGGTSKSTLNVEKYKNVGIIKDKIFNQLNLILENTISNDDFLPF